MIEKPIVFPLAVPALLSVKNKPRKLLVIVFPVIVGIAFPLTEKPYEVASTVFPVNVGAAGSVTEFPDRLIGVAPLKKLFWTSPSLPSRKLRTTRSKTTLSASKVPSIVIVRSKLPPELKVSPEDTVMVEPFDNVTPCGINVLILLTATSVVFSETVLLDIGTPETLLQLSIFPEITAVELSAKNGKANW
ncbi:MAG: hypothetical protein ACU843_14485 [Gammaproteobacteria bacterium]